MTIYYESDYLCHWNSSKQRQNHKYFARIRLGNNRYRYFYSQAEYDAFKGNNRVKATSREKDFARNNWTGVEKALIIGSTVLGGSKGAMKTANTLNERRALRNFKAGLNSQRRTVEGYRKLASKHQNTLSDIELTDKANRMQAAINKKQKVYDRRKKAYDKTLIGMADKAISTIASIPERAKSLVSKLSKTPVREIVANNPVTKLGKSIIGKLFGKKEEKRTVPQQQSVDKDLRVNGINIKIRR